MTIGIEGDALERLVLKSLKELLVKAASTKPVVIILEDLHWSDNTSLDFLVSLFRLTKGNRILFINVFRPNFEYTSERVRGIIKERYAEISHEIYLESLVKGETETLINNLIGIEKIPLEVKKQIINRAGGNPFFIEEILRSFIDLDIIKLSNDEYELSDRIYSVRIPESINEVLMTRIDRLEEHTKSLLKVAAVIGRNFYYKILAQVAQTNEEIEAKLSFLEGIQLIRKRQEKLDVEYLFKHALAQEAAYESILLSKRKELHLKTADAIETVFSSRLHEFFGMLALHYSKGEDLDKAEEYLIKAGEEALKSSASSEAINYFQDALKIYRLKHGDRANPEKIANLEMNIGFALHNKGRLAEAIDHFDKVLKYHGYKSSKNEIWKIIHTALGIVHLIIGLYFPFLKWKKIPTSRDLDIIKLYFVTLNDIAVIYPERVTSEAFSFYKMLTYYNLSKMEGGVGMFSGASVISSFGGVSSKLSKRVLDSVKSEIHGDNIRSTIYYEFAKALHCYLWGNWKELKAYDNALVDSSLKVGEILTTTYYLDIHALYNMDLGEYSKALSITKKLGDSGDKFEHDFTMGLYYKNKTKLLMKFSKYDKALLSSDEELEFLHKINDAVQLYKGYSIRAKIQVMLGDLKGAEISLMNASNMKLPRLVPLFKMDLYLSRFIFDLYYLTQELKSQNFIKSRKSKQNVLASGLKCVRLSKRIAQDRTEIFRLMGTYYWIINSQKKALIWWMKSIKEGERLNAKLELSRTLIEIGERLSEKDSMFNKLNHLKPHEYLQKGKRIFKTLTLS